MPWDWSPAASAPCYTSTHLLCGTRVGAGSLQLGRPAVFSLAQKKARRGSLPDGPAFCRSVYFNFSTKVSVGLVNLTDPKLAAVSKARFV